MNHLRCRRSGLCALSLGLVSLSALAVAPLWAAQETRDAAVAATVERAMERFEVPGMSVTVIRDGEVIHAAGHGLRSLAGGEPVDAETLFQIASVSKAFTAAALALLVDEGRLDWEGRVIDTLPEFRMHDPWVTREFTIRDLLTHRSGLPLGAGDLLFFPPGNTTRDEIIRAMRHLEPSSSFRSKYDYDNLLYVIAGEVVSRIAGLPFEEFVLRRLLQPLRMDGCRASSSQARGLENRATPHLEIDGEREATHSGESDLMAAAGGVFCNAEGMARWLSMWLSGGETPGGERFLSEDQYRQLLGPVTLLPSNPAMEEHTGAHISAYALGWTVSSLYGQPIYTHGGGLWGMTTYLAFMPRQKLGVFVSGNLMSPAPRALTLALLHQMLEPAGSYAAKDWIDWIAEQQQKRRKDAASTVAAAEAARAADSEPSLPLEAYAGVYVDSWYGPIDITLESGRLWFRSRRSPQISGPLEHFQFNTFIARWTDRQLMADAYLSFALTPEGEVERIAMQAVSPLTDFSFDFHDLDLVRQAEEE